MSIFNRFLSGPDFDQVGWIQLTTEEQLEDLIARSHEKTMLIFKHSTTCGISASVMDRLLASWAYSPEEVEFYYLDLLAFRPISNQVAAVLNVPHQSPQAILLKNGEVVYHRSHFSITPDGITQAIEN